MEHNQICDARSVMNDENTTLPGALQEMGFSKDFSRLRTKVHLFALQIPCPKSEGASTEGAKLDGTTTKTVCRPLS